MKSISFLLHTQEPILATSLKGNPNSDVSYDYILGSVIRGALITRYINLEQNNIKRTDDILDSESFPDIKRLFFDASKTRYLNAYPVDNNQQRALPVPLSLYKNKGEEFSEDEEKPVYDLSKISNEDKEEDLPDEFSAKLLNEKFCTVDEKEIIIHPVKRRINIHHKRNRKRGKGTEGDGALFSYNAIDAGQTFRGIILCDSEEDKSVIESLLKSQDIWLGGSQSAGYGHTTIDLISENNNVTEVELDLNTRIYNKKYLKITLLSDTILRNNYGQYAATPEVLSQNILRYLNLDKELEFKENGIYSKSLIVGGFNRKWGLPLPQTPALVAGSVFVFNKPDEEEIDIELLQKLEEEGIGERRIEGFGRLIINWLDKETEYRVSLNKPKSNQNKDSRESISLSSDSLKVAEDIAMRIIRKNLDILLTNKVASTDIRRENIYNTQLSRLMIVAREALFELETKESQTKSIAELGEPITDLLKNLRTNARNQFEKTYLNNKKIDEQISEWLQNPQQWIKLAWRSESITKELIDDNSHPSIKIAHVSKTFDDYLALEYTFRLIIAITKKAMKGKKND